MSLRSAELQRAFKYRDSLGLSLDGYPVEWSGQDVAKYHEENLKRAKKAKRWNEGILIGLASSGVANATLFVESIRSEMVGQGNIDEAFLGLVGVSFILSICQSGRVERASEDVEGLKRGIGNK